MSDALRVAFGLVGAVGGLSGILGAVIVWRGRRGPGGTLPPYMPAPDTVSVVLSPGWVSPEVERYLPTDMIDQINAPGRNRER